MEPEKDKDAFGPTTLRILDQAYREAKRRLQGSASQRNPSEASPPTPDLDLLAKKIMLVARTGERNVKRLVEGALAGWRGKQ